MQETGSLERETESYHSNMFNLEVEDDHNSNKYTEKSENSSQNQFLKNKFQHSIPHKQDQPLSPQHNTGPGMFKKLWKYQV